MIRKLGLLCLIGVMLGAPAGFISSALAQGAPPTDCDRLAAEADDAERVAPGVPDDAIDPAAAIPACERAIAQFPDSRRLVFQLGRASLRAQNLNVAFLRFHEAAAQGHVLAQTYVGTLYLEGSGALKDEAQAASWFRKAADAGDSVAQYNLATLYETGRGVARDMAEAAALYQRSAEQGFSLAQASLGRLYAAGIGVARDVVQSAEWYRKAAEQGDESAQYRLATMYQDGQGVPKDAGLALAWYRKAAEKGYLDSAAKVVALEAAQPKPMPPPAASAPAEPAPAASPAPAPPAASSAASEGEHPKGGSTFFRIILAVVGATVVALGALLFVVTRKRPRPAERAFERLKAEAKIADAIDHAGTTAAETSPDLEVNPFAAALEAIPAPPVPEKDETAESKQSEEAATSGDEKEPELEEAAAEPQASEPADTPAKPEPSVAQFTATVVEAPPPPPVMKRCSQCQKEIPANDYFCCHCGALAIRFSDCQHDVREDARFCPRCGAILRWATQKTNTQVAAGGAT